MLPKFSVWRHVCFIAVLIPIGLSQSFFALGTTEDISTATIYGFGLCFSAVTLMIVYFNNYGLVPWFLSKARYASYFLVLLSVVAVFVLVKYLVQFLLFSRAGVPITFNWVTIGDGLSNWMTYTVCIVSGSVTRLFKRWTVDHETIESLKNKQLRNRIDELKSRIQPKFLYATLGYVAKMVKSEPDRASDVLFKLSELLKYQLYDAARNRVLLTAEIVFIRNYLTLVQQSSEYPFVFALTTAGDTQLFIPPALFTPWIEEMIQQRPTEMSVRFEVLDNSIEFRCSVVGVAVSACDFQVAEQKVAWFYGTDAIISQENDSIKLILYTC